MGRASLCCWSQFISNIDNLIESLIIIADRVNSKRPSHLMRNYERAQSNLVAFIEKLKANFSIKKVISIAFGKVVNTFL